MEHEQALKWLTRPFDRSCMTTSFQRLHWYHFTRLIGSLVVFYELLLDKGSPDRGTVIIAGLGLVGYEFVARTDKAKATTPAPTPKPEGEANG